MLKCLLLLIFLYEITAQEGNYCKTPLGERGRCVNIKKCDPLLTMLKTQSQNPEVRSYLIRSTCGYSGSIPVVCCPQRERNLQVSSSTSTVPLITTEKSTSTATEKQKEQIEDGKLETLPNYPKCGLTNSSDFRVVGGTPASLGQFPWIAALGYRNSNNPDQPRWLCGGSLITERHILTAAHCVKGRDDLYLVRLGELDLYSDTDGANPIDIPIIDKVVHADYNTAHYTNDIAILKLANKAEHPSVWPVCLPSDVSLRSQTFDKYHGFVAGWGNVHYRGPSSSFLQYASLPIVSTDTCKNAFSKIKQAVIDEKILCAGYPDGSKDSCNGDSGGPFVLGRQKEGKIVYYLLGLVSYGVKCAEPGYYGVYSRTTAFLDWIASNLH